MHRTGRDTAAAAALLGGLLRTAMLDVFVTMFLIVAFLRGA